MSDAYAGTRLGRAALAARTGVDVPTPAARIVHLGLGAFHRAHQAWYTARCDPGGEWGIVAFTGRSSEAADRLAAQDGLYTLVERSERGDVFEIVPSIVGAFDGRDLARLAGLLADPVVAIVTITVTEAGYRLDADGLPDRSDPLVVADLARLSAWVRDDGRPAGWVRGGVPDAPVTALGRLLVALDARRRSGAGPVAVVPCDNVPDNGALVRGAVVGLARGVSAALARWIDANVSFVSTSVDRITPQTTSEDLEVVERITGWRDEAVVVTEPFSDWVLSGAFPAGRPPWERAGARFVEDIEPFERRKLWMLNGAHSLLAYAGLLRGRETVAEAIADERCQEWVSALWDEDARHLPGEVLDLTGYRAALLERFRNARIAHRLEQIGADGVTKLRVRLPAVLLGERAAGRDAAGAVRVLGSWAAMILSGRRLPDSQAQAIDRVLADPAPDRIPGLVRLIDERMACDPAVVSEVAEIVRELVGSVGP